MIMCPLMAKYFPLLVIFKKCMDINFKLILTYILFFHRHQM